MSLSRKIKWLPQAASRRTRHILLGLLCSIALCSTAPTFCSSASAAPIATPTPGTATPLPAPAPNPAPYNYVPQTVLQSAWLNSNNYALWNEVLRLEGLLNATGASAYACGPCLTSLTASTGIAITPGSQVSGVGVTDVVQLAHGDYDDLTNAQTISGAKQFTQSIGVTNSGGQALVITSTNAHATQIGPDTGSANVQGVPCNLFGIGYTSVQYYGCFSTAGALGVAGTVTASNFFTGSRREWKTDIHSLRGVDALDVLARTDWASFRYRATHGDPNIIETGFIANDTPAVLSGGCHCHFNAQAVATYDALAILQLQHEVTELRTEVDALRNALR